MTDDISYNVIPITILKGNAVLNLIIFPHGTINCSHTLR